MEPLEQDMNFSTEDMDGIDFTSVEPNVSSSSLLQMLQPEGTYTSGPVLDLQEYATPLSPSIPLGELGDDTVLPHDNTADEFDASSSLPVSVVVGPTVESMSMSTAMNPVDNSGLDVNPLLLPGMPTCELGGNLPQGPDMTSDCENALNKEFILENVPANIHHSIESSDNEVKGTLPSLAPVQLNLPQFPNVTNSILQLSAPGPNIILASPSCVVPNPATNAANLFNVKGPSLKTVKPSSALINNLISTQSTTQAQTVGNVQSQQIRVEFNKISPETTIVKLCFGPHSGAEHKMLNQDVILNQQMLAALIAGSNKSVDVSPLENNIQTPNNMSDIHIVGESNEEEEMVTEEVPVGSKSMNLSNHTDDEDDDKPLQQLKEEMACAIESDLGKDHIDISQECSQINPNPVEISLTQDSITNVDVIPEETIQHIDDSHYRENSQTEPSSGEQEVEISSLLSDIKNMKTLAKLDEISIQINDGQYREVSGKMRWCCSTCDKSYTTKHNLILHTLGHHGIKPHVCSVCKRMFSQRSHLKTHILTHGNIKPHTCHICHRSFTQLSHVKRHISTHMEKRPYHCDECNRGFAYPSELKAHKQKHQRDKDHHCDQCSATFDDPKKLSFHLKTYHKDPSELTCKECGREYTYPSQLKDHMVKHTGMRPYICDECGMDFMKEHHLRSHIYTHTGMKPWQCSICSRTFNQKANMLRHMLIHETQRKFECDVCHKSFSQPQTLKAHRVTHSEKKPYNCQICGKEFGRLHTLQGHMHVHLDSRPHICFCGASFTLKGNLTRHKKVKHDIADPNQCTEEEAAKILEIMSTKRRGPTSETGTGSKADGSKEVEETATGRDPSGSDKGEDETPCNQANTSKAQSKDLETLTSLKPNCNDTASLLALDSSPMVESFHTYCAKDTNTSDRC